MAFAGIELPELFDKVVRLNESQADFAVPANECRLVQTESGVMLAVADVGTYLMTRHFEGQLIADINNTFECNLTTKYYDSCRGILTADERDLQCINVNAWLSRMKKTKLVRCYANMDGDDIARAWLSNRYRRIDYADTLQAIMPDMMEWHSKGKVRFIGADVTETKLHLKWLMTEGMKQITYAPGHQRMHDEIAFGGHCGTSEVGASPLFAQGITWVQWCSNTAVHEEFGKKVRHAGTKDELDENEYKQETIALRDQATLAEFRDIVNNTVNETYKNKIMAKINKALGIAVPDARQAIEKLGKKWNATEKEKDSILFYFSSGNWGNSLFGLHSAITRSAEDAPDFEQATELEMWGGRLLNLSDSEIKEVLAVA